ncbi:MAG: hypothetical protein IPG87_10665 [Saprospiraceae bacterium]|nr:hypothetical protein [Candidatus Vicinibacter affinis]
MLWGRSTSREISELESISIWIVAIKIIDPTGMSEKIQMVEVILEKAPNFHVLHQIGANTNTSTKK